MSATKTPLESLQNESPVKIDVTQDDIDHGEHNFCNSCMLGRAISKVLKDEYWPRVESRALTEPNEVKVPSSDNYHVSVSICEYGKTWPQFYTVDLPEIARKSADNWEAKSSPGEYKYHEDFTLKPFSFELNIPKEYLKNG